MRRTTTFFEAAIFSTAAGLIVSVVSIIAQA